MPIQYSASPKDRIGEYYMEQLNGLGIGCKVRWTLARVTKFGWRFLVAAAIERSNRQLLGAGRSRCRHDRLKPCGISACSVFVIAAATVLLLVSLATAGAPVKRVRRVLVFNDLGSISSPGFAVIDRAIFAGLEKSPYQIEFYHENLETTLFSDKDSQREFRDWYVRKYRDRQPDVIIAVGQDSLNFMIESHETAFPNIPIIFCGSTEDMIDNFKPDSHFTGVWAVAQPDKTLNVALQLQPRTQHVVVVGGVGAFDRDVEAIVKKSFQIYESKLDFTYLTDLDMPTLLERLKHLPSNTIVFHTSIMQDAAGARFIDASQSVPMVASAANAPVFVVDDVDLGNGTVGGNLLSWAATGQIAAQMAVRILNGEKPQDIPIVKTANVYMFDWRALQRWGFKESDLPPHSVVLYRQASVWGLYKWYIIGGASLILVEALLISGLLWQRARRRKAEEAVRESEQRFRLVANTAPVLIWMSGHDKLHTYFNQSWLEFTGHSLADELGKGWEREVHPDDLGFCLKASTDAFNRRESFKRQYRLRRYDGEYRWMFDIGVPRFNTDGGFAGYIGSCVDVTERKMAEDTLSNFSGRLISAQEEERRRIAREIHDDYNQRLAVLANDLEEAAESVADFPVETSQRLHQLWNAVSELGADLHSLSHRLHSSTLESLGLVAGARAFCQEFADQQQIQVDFTHENVPRRIAGDVALCLFRITQEGLRNVKRHSGTNRAEVRLEGLDSKLHLSISDRGRGFDPNQRSERAGIGIYSMEERLRSLGGSLEVHSKLMEGTRIDAWLPFKAASQDAA
jgi:PAS domain S-box-containing protein